MKIVLDINVLAAGVLNPRGNPADILNLILNEEVTLCYDDRIAAEYRSVLMLEKFNLAPENVDTLINHLEDLGDRVVATPLNITIDDPDDVMFVEVLESSESNYLVTGNIKHFASLKDKRIVTPSQLLKMYFAV